MRSEYIFPIELFTLGVKEKILMLFNYLMNKISHSYLVLTNQTEKKSICAFFSTLPHIKFNKGIQVKIKNI